MGWHNGSARTRKRKSSYTHTFFNKEILRLSKGSKVELLVKLLYQTRGSVFVLEMILSFEKTEDKKHHPNRKRNEQIPNNLDRHKIVNL